MRLSDLRTGESAVILRVLGHGGFRRRILEMGFIKGKVVEVLLNAPLNNPIKYRIMDYEVSLRQSEASMIEVLTLEEARERFGQEALASYGTITEETISKVVLSNEKHINVAFVGNPNSGKTSIFNHASGRNAHVGNYGGVTVDAHHGRLKYGGYTFDIYDLPGTYALTAYSPEEIYVRRHLIDNPPDVIINVVAASNLERNLYLTTELIDINMKMVIALNMYDELEESGAQLDYKLLGELLGAPMVPTIGKSGKGLYELFDAVIRTYEDIDPVQRHIHINHGETIEGSIDALKNELEKDPVIKSYYHLRYISLKMLERDKEIEAFLSARPEYEKVSKLRDTEVKRVEKEMKEDIETAISDQKYGFIAGALKETYKSGNENRNERTNAIDLIVTSKWLGFPIFIFLMWLMFWTTFKLGEYPMGWIEEGVAWFGSWVAELMNDGYLKDLIVDGIIAGVGGVIVFLPNILILYLFISLMEGTGYMARAAFIMDRIMHKIGLHGKSFIPLIMGFGCNVPAIMATRTIESRSSRIITILINPFMSCSARIPVFVLFAGTFFPDYSATVMVGLYLFGIVMAIATSLLLRRFMFREEDTPFVMELPPYRTPTAQATLRHMWDKAKQYLKKMGGIILIASVVIWFLSYFPRHENPVMQQQESYIGQVGQFIEPIFEPMDLNWKASVAILTGAAAKEVVVSTLGVLYSNPADENVIEEDDFETLSMKLTEVNPVTGKPDFTKPSALAFLIFVLLCFPCIATIAAVKQEAGGWKWAVFSVLYNTILAWIMSFIIYRIALLIFRRQAVKNASLRQIYIAIIRKVNLRLADIQGKGNDYDSGDSRIRDWHSRRGLDIIQTVAPRFQKER